MSLPSIFVLHLWLPSAWLPELAQYSTISRRIMWNTLKVDMWLMTSTTAMSMPSKKFDPFSSGHAAYYARRVINPLSGISKTVLLNRVSRFCEAYGLQDKETTFHKGALIAQNPANFEAIEELTDDDRYHLRRETTRKSPLLANTVVLFEGLDTKSS
jgi:hypothetical protein